MVWKVSGCCCMNLRVAGYVHGVVSIALIVLGFILTVLRLNNSQIQKIGEYELDPKKLAAYYFVSYATDALVSGSMIIGISTNKHLMLLPWLILRAIGLITMAPIIMILMVVGIFLSFQDPAGLMVVAVALFIGLIVALFVWSWIVIYSLYREIRDNRNKPLPIQMPLPYIERGPMNNDPAPPYQKFENIKQNI
ncbi:uncharacterized protein LOC129921123 [Episyrphus balteatus]|uniref:uncharacterized protein LOC129921123 n=1 Tax=Episyrphus balteatus TaxID=286459 RepID=UPI00248668A5|nr:uncharacterized protein LOC129921123 [Episyrphus balteatus]